MQWKIFIKRFTLAQYARSLCPLKLALQEDCEPKNFPKCLSACYYKMNYTVLERMEIKLVQKGLLEDEAIAIVELVFKATQKDLKGKIWNQLEKDVSLLVLESVWNRVYADAIGFCIDNPNTIEAVFFVEKASQEGHPFFKSVRKFGSLGIPKFTNPEEKIDKYGETRCEYCNKRGYLCNCKIKKL